MTKMPLRMLTISSRDGHSVEMMADGTRVVTKGNVESWTRYVIVPRRAAIRRIRRLRAKHDQQYHDCDWWHLIPTDRLFSPEHYGGPGRGFARLPVRIKSSRKYLVFAQGGGLDI